MRHEHNAMVMLVNRLRKHGVPAVIRRLPPTVHGNHYTLAVIIDTPEQQYVTITAKKTNAWDVWIPTVNRRLNEPPEFNYLVRPPFSRWSAGNWLLFETMTTADVERWFV